MKMPDKLGKYKILELIQRGSKGSLYKAYDRVDERVVALKVVSSDSRVSKVGRARFFRAGKVWKQLDHPHVITVYDLDFSGIGSIAMEFLQREELKQIIDRRLNLSLKQKLSIMTLVCKGLDYIHQQGIVHRDIRPETIFVLPYHDVLY